MNKLELVIFNVGHGLSVALIERPENYVILVDLGCDDNFSPFNYLLRSMNLYPDILYITHPHGDHISDIYSVDSYSKYITMDYQDYDWKDVESREKPELRETLRKYRNYISNTNKGSYNGSGDLKYWRYTPQKAKGVFGESTYINNSSLFLVYWWKTFKIAIPGDLHSNAMDKFINYDDFKNTAKSTYILIAPHHGHKEGFTSLWPEKIGKPYVTIASVQERDPNVDSRYSSEDFAQGISFNGEKRYSLTTRSDGNIKVSMYYDSENKATWSFSSFKKI